MAITKTREIYYIKNGCLHYRNDMREEPREWSRGPIPEEVIEILTKKRTIRFQDKRARKDVWIFENEMVSINEWVRRYSSEFKMNPYYKRPIVRAIGAVPNYDTNPELEGKEGYIKSETYVRDQELQHESILE